MNQNIAVKEAFEHNLKGVNVEIERGSITVVTGVSGSGKSSLAFDTILAEANRRFFYTLSNYSRQFLDLGTRPAVNHISGLSPAIALAQNETQPSRRATVGTLVDASELLGVIFARFGVQHCPKHMRPTVSHTSDEICEQILTAFNGRTLAICAPIAEKKKGNFQAKLQKFAQKGYLRVFIDGELYQLNAIPALEKEQKHTIKLVIDYVKVHDKSRNRLLRSIQTALEEGEGYGEYFESNEQGAFQIESQNRFSDRGGCEVCGYSWPKLDSRYFSANSLGRCETCYGFGYIDELEDDQYVFEYDDPHETVLDRMDRGCLDCCSTGLESSLKAITMNGKSVIDLQLMPIGQLYEFLTGLQNWQSLGKNPAFQRVFQELMAILKRITDVRLGYLFLCRRISTLSAGEAQRLKLSGILGENLRGVLYILDEPSQGLHASEIEQLCQSLKQLKELGNTIIIVDHDETLMRFADWIIDLGPGGGHDGGRLMAKFRPEDADKFVTLSKTAKHLCQKDVVSVSNASFADKQFIEIYKPHLNNLKLAQALFPISKLSIVTGVSGAGKSSLVLSCLYENAFDYVAEVRSRHNKKFKFEFRYCERIAGLEYFSSCALIDRKPVAKSHVSMPATYLDVFTELRELYANLAQSQIAGFTARSFSLASEGGRCEECHGRGSINLKMRFLADSRVTCPICNGDRYKPHMQNIKFSGLSLSEVLKLSIEDAYQHFKHFKKIANRLKSAMDLGLGYLILGQPSASLSGGESQRLKIAPYLAKAYNKASLIMIDEPTTGLHFEDVKKLLTALKMLVANGATVILIEHNLDVAKSCDWLVDLGPGAADRGGEVVYQGVPMGLLNNNNSVTARYF